MSDVDKNLSEQFNVEPIEPVVEKIEIIEGKLELAENSENRISKINANSDYDLVRQNLKDLIDQGKVAIEGILDVAGEGDSPRAYEVVSQLLKSTADANKDLLDLHKKKKELQKEDGGPKNQTTNNNLFVGSTKDLQKLLGRMIKDDEENNQRELPRES
tara:strand:+ start:82 stop:558 length:477 start_codon:yes stop_codon:yes gene_type:complete